MNGKTYAARILTPYYMAEHREEEEKHLREKALLEAAKELENGKKYVIEITASTAERHEIDAMETRVKIHIQETETVPVMIGIDWAGQPKTHHRENRRRGGWGRSKRTRSRKRL